MQWITPDNYKRGTIAEIPIQKRGRGNPATKNKIKYKDVICAFDIETTRLEEYEQSIMYVWMLNVHGKCTIVGRTWEELDSLFKQVIRELKDNERLVIYVHNLSYEFQFLQAIIDWQNDDIFAVDSRKVLKATAYDALEFRCSYLHSNMSLAMFTEKFHVKHSKLSGEEYNYSKRRFPWTELSEKEIAYCLNDVVGLCEALEAEMRVDKDNLYTIPLTSTGYVRRDAKKAMDAVKHDFVRSQLPNLEVYAMLREAFRGGNTHANRYYADRVIDNVKSFDRSSSYPEVLCNCEYPISAFYHSGPMSLNEYIHLQQTRKKAFVMRIAVENIRLRDKYWGCPYLSKDKCRKIGDEAVFDNGRVLSAEYLETTVTDIDLNIIVNEYKFKSVVILDSAFARYGKLPRQLVDCIIDYYVKKTELKGEEAGSDGELLYMKSKNKLNSVYGMMAQNPVKGDIIYSKKSKDDWNKDEQKQIDKIMLKIANGLTADTKILFDKLTKSNNHAFLAYQWGVWCTAHARRELEEGIKQAGDGFVYCDTDSVKYIGDVDFSEYNAEKVKASTESGAFATDRKGKTHYMGVYEPDGEYAHFKTLGAKKYAYQFADGKTHVTIAGVTKRSGGAELDAHGGLDAFREGFIFHKSGGTESIWNDRPGIGLISIDGHKLLITPNIVIRDSTYTVTISPDYKKILETMEWPVDNWAVL